MKINHLFLVGVALIAAHCRSKSSTSGANTTAELSGQIRVDGSSTVYPITEAVAEEFRTIAPDVHVTVGVSGTGGGFQKFSRGEIDINNASRQIKSEELSTCLQNGVKYVELSVAYDGLAIVVNPGNTWVDHFTVDELKRIWEPAAQGKVKKWSQIRKGWPDEDFNLYGPGVASGTYDYFTEKIVGKSGESRGDYTASEDDNVLVQGVRGDKNAIGFFGFTYYTENRDQLRIVGVDAGKGAVVPDTASIRSGLYTPLSRPVYIYVSAAAAARPEVASFIEFYLENAAKLAANAGYVALPAASYTQQKERFAQFNQPQ